MIPFLRLLFKLLPWLLFLGLLAWVVLSQSASSFWVSGSKETYQSTLLTRVERIGRLELVQFSFQEVTEMKKISDYVDLKLFKYKPLPDAKAVLISQGVATGCVDLTQIQSSDLVVEGDTVYLTLPDPELCHFKVDLEKSRIYDLQISYMTEDEQRDFIQELYKVAEEEIKDAAMKAGILEQTRESAHAILRPMLESMSGKVVLVSFESSAIPAEFQLLEQGE
ncbi:MAG: DUF4230 domain-containing protein [Bacteroidota bacterium]